MPDKSHEDLSGFIQLVRSRKSFQNTNISYPLIGTRTCASQEVRNVNVLENFTNVLNV